MGRVIAITGGKGGVGKSTTTVNLAVSLRMDGYSVAIVDADVEMPNLVEMLSIEPTATIHDVLSGRATTEEAIVEISDGFGVVPGDSGLTGYAAIDPGELQSVITTVEDRYDIVLLDTGAGLSYDDILPLGLADEIVLVSSPDPAAITNAQRTREFVEKLGRGIEGVVITKADETVDDSVADQLGARLLAVIPDDPAVKQSTAAGKPIELHAPGSPAAQAFRQLEANLTDGTLPPQRSAGGAETATADQSEPEPPAEASEEDEPPEEPDAPEDPGRPGLISRLVDRVTP